MRSSEGNVLLSIDVVTTVICLLVPIRMAFKWIPPVLGVLSFMVSATFIGSPFPGQLANNTMVLSCLVVLALVGAWHNEQVARQNFLAQRLVQKTSEELQSSYASQQDLLDEKNAFEILLSMVCDATVWLTDCGSTVLKCDERFDMMIGTSMQGKSLSTCFTPKEQSRLLDALSRVHDVPALVPTSIEPVVGSDLHINVDCFIVPHQTVCMGRTSRGDPGCKIRWFDEKVNFAFLQPKQNKLISQISD
jgi:hypothetical protein